MKYIIIPLISILILLVMLIAYPIQVIAVFVWDGKIYSFKKHFTNRDKVYLFEDVHSFTDFVKLIF